MKLWVPEGCQAVSHAGQPIEIANDGSVEVDDGAKKVLILHGFLPWGDGHKAPPLAAMTREQLVSQAMNMTINTIETISTEDIRARLAMAEESMPPDEHDDASASISVLDIRIEDIAVLRRQELFTFLRAKGVSVSLPVTNKELRAAARHAFDC